MNERAWSWAGFVLTLISVLLATILPIETYSFGWIYWVPQAPFMYTFLAMYLLPIAAGLGLQIYVYRHRKNVVSRRLLMLSAALVLLAVIFVVLVGIEINGLDALH